MPSQLKIRIGDITTRIDGTPGHFEFDTPGAYRPFVSNHQDDIHLKLLSDFPQLEMGKKHFSSIPIWDLYRNDEVSYVHIFGQQSDLQRLLVMPPGFGQADLYFAGPNGQFMDPFFGPTLEIMMINYLAQGYGVIIHACGIDCGGKGMLFAGESGAGKSTLANLWNLDAGAAVLSDDRTIIREVDGEFWMFGTPWHGEAKFGSPGGVKLENIYFLRHGKENAVQPSSAADTVTKLLQCSFPSYWDSAAMEFTMALFEGLATRISCSDLVFKPDESALEMIKGGMI